MPVCALCGRATHFTTTEFDVNHNDTSFYGDPTVLDSALPVSGSAPTVSLTTAQAGAQITRDNYHWGATLGQPTTVSFGFATSAAGYSVNNHNVSQFSAFTASEQAAARAALQFWSDVSGITFTDMGNTNNATILFRNYSDPNDASQAFAFYPSSNNQTAGSNQGDVFMNLAFASTTINPGSYDWATMIHEIGHALGLEHPGSYNAAPGQTITYNNNAEYIQDTRQYSIMSYFSESNTGGSYSVYDETPMLHDIAAIQRLYGENLNTRTGNTTYGFNSNAGDVFNITSANEHVAYTVYDRGGYDTLDFSGYSQDATISLYSESFSSVGGDRNNVCIAQNTTIEYAYGGSGNDTIFGNDVNNYLSGGNGNDYIKGAGGDDTLVGGNGDDNLIGGAGTDYIYGGTGTNSASFFADSTGFTFSETSGGLIVDSSSNGHDTLHQVQRLVFNDVTIVDDNFGDTSTTAQLAIGSSITGGMQFRGDHDWIRVQLIGGHTYQIEERGYASGNGTLSDPYVRLYNSSGVEIAHDDDAGVGLNSNLVFQVAQSGTYYLDASSYANFYTGTYTLGIEEFDKFHFVKDWDLSWHQIASGDFNRDGIRDIIWDNGNGVEGGWLMNTSGQIAGTLQLPFFPGWNVIATGDFNRDGNTDIMWQNNDGLVAEWFMGNGTRQGTAVIQNMAGWNVIASGDFNHDGVGDVVWDNGNGVLAGWLMNTNGQIAGTMQLPYFPDWHAVATGDFNRDGTTDIMWQNDAGLVAEWFMGNGTRQASQTLQNMSTWSVIAQGDFNGDGTDDVLWRDTGGATQAWLMNGANGQVDHNVVYGSTMGWEVVMAGHLDDIGSGGGVMWQNTTTGDISTWHFNYQGELL